MIQTTKTIRVKLFGSLREYGDKENAEVLIPKAQTVIELREFLSTNLVKAFPDSNVAELIRVSAFADDKSVLTLESLLEDRSWIAVLPPVCGG
jgi:molybdopterin converting factor small subunit